MSKKDALKNGEVKTIAEKKPRKPATRKKTVPTAEMAPVHVMPSREAIALLAHKYWQERGRSHGNAEQDWLRAEQELRGRAS